MSRCPFCKFLCKLNVCHVFVTKVKWNGWCPFLKKDMSRTWVELFAVFLYICQESKVLVRLEKYNMNNGNVKGGSRSGKGKRT